MAKKDDNFILNKMKEELGIEGWRTQYPSTTVSWTIHGDSEYANKFKGEAKNMLYLLKNRMNLAVPKLRQLQSARPYDDGTVIIVKSIFGQDFIEITTGLRSKEPTCLITLYDLPVIIQPMRWWPEGVHEGEEEGIDYIKTYYKSSSQNCDACSPVDFSICETGELASTYGWTAKQICTPFVYDKEGIPFREGYSTNHCVYSRSGCQAEIIKFGKDSQGTYFIWKAYTEWSMLGPYGVQFSRDGLGYLLLRAFITLNGKELCNTSDNIITVDCCWKSPGQRPLIMFWGKCDLVGDSCPVPKESSTDDIDFFWQMGGWHSMTLSTHAPTTLLFSCPPYTWTLTGPGQLILGGAPLVDAAEYRISAEDYSNFGCQQTIGIVVRDRCGSEYAVSFASCCGKPPDPLEIEYTSLQMSCSGSQTFTARGGCHPYNWSLSGGGELIDNHNGSATYIAPSTNPNCVLNPVISVSDCCGDSDSIQLAINCYTDPDEALKYCNRIICVPCHLDVPNQQCVFEAVQGRWSYNCDGDILDQDFQDYPAHPVDSYSCTGEFTWGCGPIDETPCGAIIYPGDECDPACENWPPASCLGWEECAGVPCGTLKDMRTVAMKNAGCCPLNPLTGLPF